MHIRQQQQLILLCQFWLPGCCVESGTVLERGRGFKGDWLYSVDECAETDSPALDRDVAEYNDLPRRSFEEAVPYKSWQPADLPDIFKQRCETGVQTEVTQPLIYILLAVHELTLLALSVAKCQHMSVDDQYHVVEEVSQRSDQRLPRKQE